MLASPLKLYWYLQREMMGVALCVGPDSPEACCNLSGRYTFLLYIFWERLPEVCEGCVFKG